MTEITEFCLDDIPPSKRKVELRLSEEWHDGEPTVCITIVTAIGDWMNVCVHAFPLMVAAEKLFEQTREAVRQIAGDEP